MARPDLHTRPDASEPRAADAAISGLLDRCGRSGFSIAYDLLRDPGEAEDAVQEALARAFANHGKLRDGQAIDAWFYRALTNGCLKILRRRSVHQRLAKLWQRADRVGPVESDLGMLRALKRLPARQQAALVLHHGHGFTVGEVAQALGVRHGTAKTHLARGMQAMRKSLGVEL